MALLLHLETSTTMCSVALSEDENLLCSRALNQGYTHAENLHVFIQDVLKEAGREGKELSAVSVSKGPGSYTGLRIGVSAAKGLAFALNIPLISLETLQIITASLKRELFPEGSLFCPMLDARRMEVYTALFNAEAERQSPIEALILDEASLEKFKAYKSLVFFGDGMPKCKSLLSQLPAARFVDNLVPHAENMVYLARQKFENKEFEDVAYFEPYYLKEFMIKG